MLELEGQSAEFDFSCVGENPLNPPRPGRRTERSREVSRPCFLSPCTDELPDNLLMVEGRRWPLIPAHCAGFIDGCQDFLQARSRLCASQLCWSQEAPLGALMVCWQCSWYPTMQEWGPPVLLLLLLLLVSTPHSSPSMDRWVSIDEGRSCGCVHHSFTSFMSPGKRGGGIQGWHSINSQSISVCPLPPSASSWLKCWNSHHSKSGCDLMNRCSSGPCSPQNTKLLGA